ncbi:hypothetical protein PFISCL1PPCAC_25253, partial [Pristionchus fissidentatus]
GAQAPPPPYLTLSPMQSSRVLALLLLSMVVIVAALPAPVQEREWREKRLSQQALIRLMMRNDRIAHLDGMQMGKRSVGPFEIERQTRDSSAHCFLSPIQCWNNRRRR